MSEISDQKPRAKRRKRSWSRRFLGLGVLLLVGGYYVMSLVGTQITAPDWVRHKVTERINNDLDTVRIEFGEVAVVMQDDWTPRLLLRDVELFDAQGATLVTLSDLTSTVALSPLLKGKLQPTTIWLTGARIKLRREADGAVDLSLSDTGSSVDKAAGFAALVDDMDALLLRPQFAALSRIEAGNLSVWFEDLRADRTWNVDGGRLALDRAGDDLSIRGDFALLSGRAEATTLEMSYAGKIGSTAADLALSFEDMAASDIAGQSPALALLRALDAPISGALRASVDEQGQLGPLSATLQIGAGVLQPTQATAPIAFTSARSYFTYDPASQTMQMDELSLTSDWVTARAAGHAYLVDVENGLPREVLGQMTVTHITANPPNLYPEPVSLEGATMDLRLQIDPFVLTLGEMSLSDQGNRLVVKGALRAEPEGWDLALDGHLNALAPDRLLELWPQSFKPGTRDWIEENVEHANLHNIQVALRLLPKHENKPDIYLGFDFDSLKTKFLKTLPPIEGGSGHASLNDNKFVITAGDGHVTAAQGGRVDITGTSFIVPDVRVKFGPARVILRAASTITAALSLLDEEPLGYISKAGQSVTLADGQARLQGEFDLLLKPKLLPEEVQFDVTGTLSDVRSDTLVPDRVLRAATLDVVADNGRLKIGGKAQVGNLPVEGHWQTVIGPKANGTSQVTGRLELSERFADEFRIGLPAGSISGSGWANIVVDLVRGAPGRFVLSSDLAGVGLSLRQLGWSLPRGQGGSLNVEGALGTPPSIENISLAGGGLEARGSVNLNADGSLRLASFSRVNIGTWLNAPVDLIGRGAGVPPAVRVRGGTIDLRQTSLGGDDDGSNNGGTRQKNGGPVSLELDSLQISDGLALTTFKAELNMSRGVEGNFTGKVNGGTPVTGRVVPQNGRSAFRIQSDNAGGVMSSAGFLKQGRDGKMDLILTPAEDTGSYNGKLGIDGFRIKDAPALAALINAISVVGLFEQLDSGGLHFKRVDAKFHLSPDRVTLLEGSAVGASLGISMDGYYYLASGRMDMQGVFSPLYLVNAIGGVLTRKGEGLFGFNYTIKGLASSPKVKVNPLTGLAPGVLRELFRRQPPKIQSGDAIAQGEAAQTSQDGSEARSTPKITAADR